MELPGFPDPNAYGFAIMNRAELVILIARTLTRIKMERHKKSGSD